MTRVCKRCSQDLPQSSFSKNRKSKDGLQIWCKACNSAYQKRWREHNADYQAGWREKHPGYHHAYHKQWRCDNESEWRAHLHQNRVRRKARKAEGDSARKIAAWIKKQKKLCYWCGNDCRRSFHVDHYKPLSSGGKHEVENLVISCPQCNWRKGPKDPYEFANKMGRLF
tara:strand:+ start:319 stop:825 length:507 start_codon:yes stop_codon:yes gene_type:complete